MEGEAVIRKGVEKEQKVGDRHRGEVDGELWVKRSPVVVAKQGSPIKTNDSRKAF